MAIDIRETGHREDCTMFSGYGVHRGANPATVSRGEYLLPLLQVGYRPRKDAVPKVTSVDSRPARDRQGDVWPELRDACTQNDRRVGCLEGIVLQIMQLQVEVYVTINSLD